jgi:hypothetical protein
MVKGWSNLGTWKSWVLTGFHSACQLQGQWVPVVLDLSPGKNRSLHCHLWSLIAEPKFPIFLSQQREKRREKRREEKRREEEKREEKRG